jgi:transcriptional regulator with XRE-family HTH domain
MYKKLSTAEKLKAIREEAGMTIREVADELGRSPSSYQHYEDRYKKEYLPLDLMQSLALVFMTRGIEPDRLLYLAGYNRDFDIAGEEVDELGMEPSPIGDDGKLVSKRSILGQDKALARNLFTINFFDDLIEITAQVDHAKLKQLIKRLQAISDSYED